jgi:hypothetical protein
LDNAINRQPVCQHTDRKDGESDEINALDTTVDRALGHDGISGHDGAGHQHDQREQHIDDPVLRAGKRRRHPRNRECRPHEKCPVRRERQHHSSRVNAEGQQGGRS